MKKDTKKADKPNSTIRMVGIDEHIHKKLAKIAEVRREKKSFVKTMKDIVAEAVTAIHKRECK